MTGVASAASHTQVVELGSSEGLCRMAGVAAGKGLNVLRRLDNIAARQPHPAGMTTVAVAWRTLEYTVDVARLAARRAVHTGESKAGFQMVKIINLDLRYCQCGDDQQCPPE